MEEKIQYELDEIQRYALMMRTKGKERTEWLGKLKESIKRLESYLVDN
jgi:hypothetical protein